MKKMLVIAAMLFALAAYAQDYQSFPMWNTKLPSRFMTIYEKLSRISDSSTICSNFEENSNQDFHGLIALLLALRCVLRFLNYNQC